MKTLNVNLTDKLNTTVTKPGYLIKISYSTTLYYSTRGEVTWNGHTWHPFSIKVSGISQDGTGNNTAKIDINNIDVGFSAVVLDEGASDIPVEIYLFYEDNYTDVIPIFSGVIDGADISMESISFNLISTGNTTLFSPRVFITKSIIKYLQPSGTKISVGTENFVLERK